MRREFVAMESALQAFIEQPDYPTLIVNGGDADIVFPVRGLQNWEKQWKSHLFQIFPFECNNAGDYLQACLDLLILQIEAVNENPAPEEEPWSPLPLVCLDPRQAPCKRLRAAIEYVREHVHHDTDIIWGLLPSGIGDRIGYKAMIAPLLARADDQDWMNGHRFLVRDCKTEPFLLPDLKREKADDVLVLDVDFSEEKSADATIRTVNDVNVPVAERMQALIQLAGLDLAHQRYDQALEKYALLYSHYAEQQDAVGQTLALGGAGDVEMRLGNNLQAKRRYQQALAVAAPDGNLPVLLNLLQAAGECCLQLNQFEEAEGYLNLADQTAGKLISPFAKISALEKLGAAQLGQRKAIMAVQTWIAAKDLCLEFECPQLAVPILDRLISAYAMAGRSVEAKAYQLEKQALVDGPLS
ncbi:MAG: tetratricopeptide repeat protein [Methylococcaceae bacterium]|nr:tetratricopeptide repeat protein [Methylococcaceae bacterium]